jgi:RHS repeat-associated protein
MLCRRSPHLRRAHRKSHHLTPSIRYGYDGDRLVCTQTDTSKVHTVYEPGSFVPLLRISQDVNADSPKTEAEATEANARGLLALASKHGKPDKDNKTAVNPADKAKEPIKLPGFGTAQWAALSKSFAHLAEKGYPEHIKTALRQGGLDPDKITAMAKAAVAQQQAEQTAKLTIQMYHCNHLGTPIALINTQGMIDWAVELDPWGNVLNEFNPKNIDQPIRMQGQQIDRESGLFYNRHRYYDPAMGRYITQDPIGLNGGMNLYGYVNDPNQWIDPLGLRTAALRTNTTLYRQQPLTGVNTSLGYQPAPVYRAPSPVPYEAKQTNMQLTADSIGNLDKNTPSNVNWGENPLPSRPAQPNCTIICHPPKLGMCAPKEGCWEDCGPALKASPPRGSK